MIVVAISRVAGSGNSEAGRADVKAAHELVEFAMGNAELLSAFKHYRYSALVENEHLRSVCFPWGLTMDDMAYMAIDEAEKLIPGAAG